MYLIVIFNDRERIFGFLYNIYFSYFGKNVILLITLITLINDLYINIGRNIKNNFKIHRPGT